MKKISKWWGAPALNNDNNNNNNNNRGEQLYGDFVPGPMDVICAPGKKAYRHMGNQRYRKFVKSYLPYYSKAKYKLEKSYIVSFILTSIREHSSSGVGFVQNKNGRWEKVGDHAAREKISQSFRDLLQNKYSSSSKAKKERQNKGKRENNNHNSNKRIPSSLPTCTGTSTVVSVNKQISPFAETIPRSTSSMQSNDVSKLDIIVDENDENSPIVTKQPKQSPTNMEAMMTMKTTMTMTTTMISDDDEAILLYPQEVTPSSPPTSLPVCCQADSLVTQAPSSASAPASLPCRVDSLATEVPSLSSLSQSLRFQPDSFVMTGNSDSESAQLSFDPIPINQVEAFHPYSINALDSNSWSPESETWISYNHEEWVSAMVSLWDERI